MLPSLDAVQGIITGLAIPFGSPDHRDSDGEYFSPRTDLGLDLITGERPVLFHHGLRDGGQVEVVGRVKQFERTAAGIVATVALDRASAMFGRLVERAKAGLLGFSSGTVPHLFKKNDATGEILRWPWIELSLTPTPSSVDARIYSVKGSDAIAHLAAVGIAAPALKSLLRAPIDAPDLEVMMAENELALAKTRLADARAADQAFAEFLSIDNEVAAALERIRA